MNKAVIVGDIHLVCLVNGQLTLVSTSKYENVFQLIRGTAVFFFSI